MSAVKKIGLVGPLPPPYGGMANQVRQLHQLLTAEGIEVEVVAVNGPYKPAWAEKIPVARALFRLLPYLVQLWHAAGQVQLFHVFANSGWSWHLFATPAITIARLRKLPVIINYRGGEARPFLERAYRWVRPALSRTNVLVVPSGYLKEVFADWNHASVIVPNIIDLELFGAATTPRTFGDAPHVVVTRNLETIYDVATALRGFKRVHERFSGARLTVAGEGPEHVALVELTKSLGLHTAVTFAGRLSNQEIAELYATADLMLNTSRVDNMPISILEALASGVPVVTTRAGGIPFIVTDGKTAALVDIGDDQALGERAIQILSDATLRGNMIAAGQAEVRRYSWPSVRKRWLDVYTSVLTDNAKLTSQSHG